MPPSWHVPDLTLTETVLAAITAAVTGGAGAMLARRPRPGSPEDHEQRMVELERRDRDCMARLSSLEARMSAQETATAAALARLTESNDRIWKAIDHMRDSIDGLRDAVVRVDVETTTDREERRRSRPGTEPREPPR